VLSLCETNKDLKDSIFTPLNQLHICFHPKFFLTILGLRQDDRPLLTALIVAPNPYSDPAFMEQLVRAMAAGASSKAPRVPERVGTF
jgi:hypothetical protein